MRKRNVLFLLIFGWVWVVLLQKATSGEKEKKQFNPFYAQSIEFKGKRSCDHEDIKFCALLGVAEYEKGHLEKAKEILKETCERKDPLACLNFGLIEIRAGNWRTGKEAFQSACQQGDVEACKIVRSIGRKRR